MRQDTAPLWHAFKEQGCEQARDALIEIHRPYARLTVQRIASASTPERAEDLESEALIALIRAVDRFDPDRGIRFVSYAVTMMRGAVREALRQEQWAPRSVIERVKRGEAEYLQVVSLTELEESPSPAFSPIDPGPGPEEQLLSREPEPHFAAVLQALKQLARTHPTYAAVIERHVLHGVCSTELAEEWGISKSVVFDRKKRGLQLLRRALCR